MTHTQKYILWGVGVLCWVYGLSILLSYVAFGYLDGPTVAHMALVLAPVLMLGAVLLFVLKRPRDLGAREEEVAHIGRAVTVKP